MHSVLDIRHHRVKYHSLKSLFCYLIGPMKEVVQGLGVTAERRTVIKDHNLNLFFSANQTAPLQEDKTSWFNCLGLIIQEVFFSLRIRQTHHKTSSRQVPSSSSMSTERKRTRIIIQMIRIREVEQNKDTLRDRLLLINCLIKVQESEDCEKTAVQPPV